MALLSLLVMSSMGLIGYVVGRALRLNRPELIAFLLVVTLSNTGTYGLPLVLFAFGTDALANASVYFVTSSILTNTVGVFLAAAGRKSVRDALVGIVRTPVVYAAAGALLILASGVSVPAGIIRPVGLLSAAALPVMILVLGMQLERAAIPDRPSLVAIAAAISLLAAPIVALLLTSLLGITGSARQAGVILASTPVAVMTTILSLEFDVAPTFVTSTVFISTLLSPLTLTFLIAYLAKKIEVAAS